jgi:ABC-type dipeptide/oligopeptide/nickel transport system permease component
MIQRLFVAFIVAVVAGICAMSLPRDSIAHLVMFRDFFDMALPILAFGALVKYLCTCCYAADCKCNCGSTSCTCVKK